MAHWELSSHEKKNAVNPVEKKKKKKKKKKKTDKWHTHTQPNQCMNKTIL